MLLCIYTNSTLCMYNILCQTKTKLYNVRYGSTIPFQSFCCTQFGIAALLYMMQPQPPVPSTPIIYKVMHESMKGKYEEWIETINPAI